MEPHLLIMWRVIHTYRAWVGKAHMRASEIFNAQVLIISTFGPDVTSLIAPSNIYNDN